MLRPKKFRPFETRIIWGIGLLLFAAAVVGLILAFQRAQWGLGFASAGVLALGAVYFCAARRGKPL